MKKNDSLSSVDVLEELESISGTTMTLKEASGTTVTVTLPSTTTYHAQAAATAADVTAGKQVQVQVALGGGAGGLVHLPELARGQEPGHLQERGVAAGIAVGGGVIATVDSGKAWPLVATVVVTGGFVLLYTHAAHRGLARAGGEAAAGGLDLLTMAV